MWVAYAAGLYSGMMQAPMPVYVEYSTVDGKPYYYNVITGTTQWEKPPPNVRYVSASGQPQRLEPRPVLYGVPNNLAPGTEKQNVAYVPTS